MSKPDGIVADELNILFADTEKRIAAAQQLIKELTAGRILLTSALSGNRLVNCVVRAELQQEAGVLVFEYRGATIREAVIEVEKQVMAAGIHAGDCAWTATVVIHVDDDVAVSVPIRERLLESIFYF